MEKLKETLKSLIFECDENGLPSLVRLVFGDCRKKSLPYRKVTIRPVKVKGEVAFQAEYTYRDRVLHDNLSREEAFSLACDLILRDFKQINAFTLHGEVQILAARPDLPKIIAREKEVDASCRCGGISEASLPQDRLTHDRSKTRIIPNGKPCDFLIRLGVMDAKGNVFPKHYAKYRQINRYLEIVDDTLGYLPKTDRPLRIIDFGCGKAYLTFALYYYLKILQHRNVEIIGLDLKEDVIQFCAGIAEDLGYRELHFLRGDIADYTNDHADMVVTLHACDTATDYALINAVSWNAPVILSVPCCQHELFGQIRSELHAPMYKHGILKERFTEILTDGLRALKLEEAGYKVSLIEFTSLEHTARNIMIRAVREKQSRPNPKAGSEYRALRDYYKVSPTIDKLMIQ